MRSKCVEALCQHQIDGAGRRALDKKITDSNLEFQLNCLEGGGIVGVDGADYSCRLLRVPLVRITTS